MNHTTENLVRERGPVRVAWVCLGEGYNGEYDPKNPEDELLLRFDVAVRDEDIGDFVTTESRCTCFAAKAPIKDSQIVYKIVPYRNRRNQIFLLTNTPAAAAKSSFRPHIEYEQMTFDLYHRRK